MEAGINADQNFYRRQIPDSSNGDQIRRSYETQVRQDFDPRPQLPPKVSLVTSNLQATTANRYGSVVEADSPAPDDFYREYRGIPSSQGYSSLNTDGIMTAATSTRQVPSSFRSNGNGTTPKHPSISGVRNPIRPSYRSASAPVDESVALNTAKSIATLNGHSKSQQPSVKDLLKRFDQNNDQTTSASRKAPLRTTMNQNSKTSPGYLKSRTTVEGRAPTGPSTAGMMTRDALGRAKSPTTSRTQRSKFAVEDQLSNNTLSSVARSTRSRQDVSAYSQASQSMINLSPPIPPKPAPQSVTRKPLFGEVVPEEWGLPGLGYGISDTRARRTSDSDLSLPAWSRQKSQPDTDNSPSSPTAWYRGATGALLDDLDANKSTRQLQKHSRSRSEFTSGKVSLHNRSISSNFDGNKVPMLDVSKTQSHSRLPVSSKRLSNPSDSASPPPTRAASPTKVRKSESRPWSPAGRSTTPTHKLPGHQAGSPGNISTNNSTLNVYISAPLPKKSPPLRSSRPRLPVSSAATANSREKVVDRSGSPQPHHKINTTKSSVNEAKSGCYINGSGPVDFAARRERIQKAYSKSIQESEEKELREAQLRRSAVAQEADSEKPPLDEKSNGYLSASQSVGVPPSIAVVSPPSPKLELKTSFLSPKDAYTIPGEQKWAPNLDSPTLGIPGSFPDVEGNSDDDEDPHSAISNATGFTEFDNEPQTEPPRQSHAIHSSHNWDDTISSHVNRELSVERSLPPANDNGSIQIVLDSSLINEARGLTVETKDTGSREAHLSEEMSENLAQGEPVFASTSLMQDLDEQSHSTSQEPSGNLADYVPNPEDGQVNGTVYESDQVNGPNTFEIHGGIDHGLPREEQQLDIPYWQTVSYPPPSFQLAALDTTSSAFANTVLTQPESPAATPVTEMDYESSDIIADTSDNLDAEFERPQSARLSTTHLQPRRASQQFAWTDYTFDASDESSWHGDQSYIKPLPLLLSRQDRPNRPHPLPKEEYVAPEVPPKPSNYSPISTPRSTGNMPHLSSSSQAIRTDYSMSSDVHGSELIGKSISDVSSIPPIPAWPDHSPPPPPQMSQFDTSSQNTSRSPPPPSLYNRRPPSSIYRTNRDSESRRESRDDLVSSRPSISTPRSSTQISLDGENTSSLQSVEDQPKPVVLEGEDKEAADKLAKRLQHRGRVIKELIDTESVYLKDMNVVEEIYKGTAEACPKLEPGDIKTIFRNTDRIVAFSTMFLDELKAASASVYYPRVQKPRQSRSLKSGAPDDERFSMAGSLVEESDYEKDRKTRIGEYFGRHLKEMQVVYTDFLKSSEQASNRLSALQSDPTVKVWLSECNTVAKDLTAAWDLDALLIKPVQRITRYQLLLNQLLEVTPEDHPDRGSLRTTYQEIGGLLKSIDDLKKRIDTVNKIVTGRKRKESDVRSGLAKAFGRSREKSLTSNSNRPPDDEAYSKLHEKFGDDYLRLQVVLRDVEYYTRQSTSYVNDFLRYLSAIELVMRVHASQHPELESKWARFNMSMRDMGTVALEDHISAVRKQVIEPFEQVIKSYQPPQLAIKKRGKRRLDYEKYLGLKAGNKKIDEKLAELVEQYEALNETLKFELPKLSALTEKIGNMCLIRFVSIQVQWYAIWQEKVKTVLEESQMPKDVEDIIDKFQRDYKYQQARILELGIANGSFLEDTPKTRLSHSTTATREDDSSTKSRSHPPLLGSRSRGHSVNSEHSPSLPTPDFGKRHSGQFTLSPIIVPGPGLPSFSTRDFPPMNGQSRAGSGSPAISDYTAVSRPHITRPSAGRSYDSGGPSRRESADATNKSPYGSAYFSASSHFDGLPPSSRPFSGLFHSAMPPDEPEDSQRSSRASSHDRDRERSSGYNVLYLAASLFEFQISATKSEAGYPYLTYQAGEIFDVIGEKGELWLAKNQDDPTDQVGWIWSKHFARLATD